MSRARRPSLPPLLPEPKHTRLREGRLAIAPGTVIAPGAVACTGAEHDRLFALACLLQERARSELALELEIESGSPPPRARGGAVIELSAGSATGVQGDAHRIEIDSQGVRLEAAGAAGLRYAVESFAQLLAAAPRATSGSRSLRACTIEDEPAFALRGVMLDVSRGKVPTLGSLEEIVDLLARMKLNALMLYTEHTFRFASHPKIGSDASPLSAAEMRHLDGYAAERHVQLIPTLQSLGHMEHVLRLPEYAHLAESERGWALSPSHEGSYELLADLYGDYLPNFRSPFFNANCDEPLDLDTGRSAALARKLGPGGVYTQHVERIHALAAEHGKRTMIWGDVVRNHPERVAQLARLDPPLVLLDWWYEAKFDYERAAVFRKHGLEFIACPGTSSWNCLFPRVENSLANISGWADAARRLGALGIVNTDWGDFGHYNLQGNSWLGFAWGAQESWSGPTDSARFDRAFGALLFGSASPKFARAYRELGAVHDPGFQIFNGSALQYAFFDDLEEGYFLSQAKRAALRRCTRRLERAQSLIEDLRSEVRREAQTWNELEYAADASLFAIRKCEAALEYFAWRKNAKSLDARERRALAARMKSLASEQAALMRRMKKLWLARSAVSNIEHTLGRARNSVRSLRGAARALEKNRAPAPLQPHEGFAPRAVLARLRASLEAGGSQASGGAI